MKFNYVKLQRFEFISNILFYFICFSAHLSLHLVGKRSAINIFRYCYSSSRLINSHSSLFLLYGLDQESGFEPNLMENVTSFNFIWFITNQMRVILQAGNWIENISGVKLNYGLRRRCKCFIFDFDFLVLSSYYLLSFMPIICVNVECNKQNLSLFILFIFSVILYKKNFICFHIRNAWTNNQKTMRIVLCGNLLLFKSIT